jgi:hypothetical protein
MIRNLVGWMRTLQVDHGNECARGIDIHWLCRFGYLGLSGLGSLGCWFGCMGLGLHCRGCIGEITLMRLDFWGYTTLHCRPFIGRAALRGWGCTELQY